MQIGQVIPQQRARETGAQPIPELVARDGTQRLPLLDGLRGAAIVLVLVGHGLWLPAGAPGPMGVTVFFVLSGFLITAKLLHELETVGRINWRRFIARRARRLVPALLLMMTALWAALIVLGSTSVRAAGDSLWSLGYCYNWVRVNGSDSALLGHLWSLSVEEQFYVVWPIVLLAAWRRLTSPAAGWTLIAASFALMGWREIISTLGFDHWARYGTDTNASGFVLGAALAILRPRLSPAFGPVGLAMILLPAVVGRDWEIAGRCLASVGTGLILAAGLPAVSWRPLRSLGVISYGVYLWHYPLATIMLPWWPPAISFVAAIAIATASFAWIERPILQRETRGKRADGVRRRLSPRAKSEGGGGQPHARCTGPECHVCG